MEENVTLLFTDTDLLVNEIKIDDFYVDISGDINERFDTSDFPNDHPSGIKSGINKKIPNIFKDEACDKLIVEFVGLRAKLYSYKMFAADEEIKKYKGVKKTVITKTIIHDYYKNCLLAKTNRYRRMNVIRSYLHDIYSEEINKVALSADDDKRYILGDGVHTLAHRHYRIPIEIAPQDSILE